VTAAPRSRFPGIHQRPTGEGSNDGPAHRCDQSTSQHIRPGNCGPIFSILGWFTCGLLCIPGAFFCLLALFARGPKGTAIAGLIVEFSGTLFFAFVGLGMIMAFLGLGAAATTAGAGATAAVREAERAQSQARSQSPAIPQTAEPASSTSTQQPDEIRLDRSPETPPKSSPNPTPVEAPAATEEPMVDESAKVLDGPDAIEAAKWRTWTTADGKHKVEAEFVKFTAGTVTLEKRDGTTVDVKLAVLCLDDQDFVKLRKWTRSTTAQ
jgi:hypothetical protein